MELIDRTVIVECPFPRHGAPDARLSAEVDNAAAAAAGVPKGAELIDKSEVDTPPADKSPAAVAADLAVRNAVRKSIEDTPEPVVAPPAESEADAKDAPIPPGNGEHDNGGDGRRGNSPEAVSGDEDQLDMIEEHQAAEDVAIDEASNHPDDERDTSTAEETESEPARIEKPTLDTAEPEAVSPVKREVVDIGNDDIPAETAVSDKVDEEVVDEERREYLRMGGFILVNDVGHRAMDAASEVPVKPLRYASWHAPEGAVSSSVALGMVGNDLASRAIPFVAPTETLEEVYEVSEADLVDNHFVGVNGVSDLDFTWRFGSGVATEVMHSAVEQGFITPEQQSAMTMGDWSDMVGSDWYKGIMNDMALTAGGIYVNYGNGIQWYTSSGGFRENLVVAGFEIDDQDPLFRFKSEYDKEANTTRLTASVTPSLRKELRRQMKEAKSPGCPVARHRGALDEGITEGNAHLQRQVDDGVLALGEAKNGKVSFTQERTPIDRGLEILAGHLNTYDTQFGTPQWTNEERTLEHRQRARTDTLRREGDVPFVRAV